MGSRRFAIACLFVLSLCAALPAQDAPPVFDVGRARAHRLTSALIEDAAALPSMEGAFVYARLAAAWLKDDPERARAWMHKAVDEVVSASRESAEQRQRRMASARALLRLAAQVAPTEGERLSSLLQAEEVLSGRERVENATALAEAALSLVEGDPRRAAALGTASLRVGVSHRLSALLWRLRLRDLTLSDGLFAEAVTAARTARSYHHRNLVAILLHIAFQGPSPSESHQRQALAAMADGILKTPVPPDDEGERCLRAAEAASWLVHFARLLPRYEPPVQAALARCRQPLGASTLPAAREAASGKPLSNVEDLLRAAEETADRKLQVEYLMRAAGMAAERADYEEAVQILDRVSLFDRPGLGDSWEDLRWGYAAELADTQLKRGDFQGVQRTVEATPPAVRPFAQLWLAGKSLKDKDKARALEFARAARQGLEGATAAVKAYLLLVRLYAQLSPGEAALLLNETVQVINRAARSSAGAAELNGVLPLADDIIFSSYRLPVSLLDLDEQGVVSAVASVNSLPVRAAMRLSLLAEVLKTGRAARPAANADGPPEQPHGTTQPW